MRIKRNVWLIAGLVVLIVSALSVVVRPKPQPVTGVIQAVSGDGKVQNVYYGDNSDGWNKSVDLGLDPAVWKLKVEKRGKEQEFLQYLHPEDNVQNWTEIVTVQRLVGPMVSRVTPEMIAKSVQSKVSDVKTYPSEVVYSGSSENGARFDVVRVLIDTDVVFTLTFSTHNPSDLQTIRDWEQKLRLAKITPA